MPDLQEADVPLNIAIVGCGEVGRCYASALAERGHRLALLDPAPAPDARALGARLGVPIHDTAGKWLAGTEIALSCVVGSASLSAAQSCLAHMAAGSLYADMTTAAPADIRRGAEDAARRGVGFADVAIMGAIALSAARTPLLVAGAGTGDLRTLFEGIGAKLRVLEDGRPGDASALKLLRSVFTKGLEALAVECLAAAEQQGLRAPLYEVLADVDEARLSDFLEMLVRTHTIHAARRLHEVEEAERQLALVGVRSEVLPGVRARFGQTVSALGRTPIGTSSPSVESALDWLVASMANEVRP